MPWFKKNKALSNCKTEADINAMSYIRTSLRAELREARNSIPGINADVDTYQSILDEENILINLFCNKLKSPIDRNVDYSSVVEEFRKFLRNIAKPCSVEQATSNKPTEPVTEPITESATETSIEPTTEPVTEPTAEPAAETATAPVTEPAAEPATAPVTEPVVEPATEKSVAEVISELNSESTMANINNVMNKYNIHYIGIGMDEFINFCKEVNETIVDPIAKKYLDRIDNNDKKIIDLNMIEIFKNIARKSRNTIISTIQMIAHDHGIDPFISLYSTGVIFVQFNGDSFTIRPDAKHDDPILIDRRGKIIIQSKTTGEYYYIPLKVKDNNKNVLNIRALTELLVNGPESVIRQNIEGTAPYYIKEMYDVPTKAIVSVFNFGSLPTNLSNERKSKIIEMIYNAIPDIQRELGGLTEMTNLIEIREDGSILLYATGRNGSINYNLVPKDQAKAADTTSAAAVIPEDTNKADPKPEDPPMSAKKSSSNKKKKKPEQTASTEPTSSVEEPNSNPQENTSADDTSADKAAS